MDVDENLNIYKYAVEEWAEHDIRSLISLIKTNEFLVNKTNKDFFNKEKKDTAWKVIGNILNKTEIEVQKKWKSLRTVFCRKLAQLKEKLPSGSGTDATQKPFKIEWEYWGDMQFLTPYMRHKCNRISNFHKKPLLVPSANREPLASLPNSGGNVIFTSATETYEDTVRCIAIEPLPSQNTDLIKVSESSCFTKEQRHTETPNSEITLLSSEDSSSYAEILSASSTEEKMSMSVNKTENKIYPSNTKCKRKAPTPDEFHKKRKKEIESCSTRMSEASQYLKETLTAVTESLKEPSGNDDLQYFACLVPIFKKLDDDQKTDCLIKLLNVVKEYGLANQQQ